LILQFILHELFQSPDRLVKTEITAYAPLDWACDAGSYNKVLEHAGLLAYAFPGLAREAGRFLEGLHLPCQEIFVLLEPFILKCKENENLLYFLLKNQKFPGVLALLEKISPQGIEKLKAAVSARLRKRGFQPPTLI